jgi:SAM-dependent methyltransferase
MSSRRRLAPELEAAAAQGGFACPQGFSGAVIGYLMAWTHGWRNTWVLSLLNVKPDDRVLEIGFGPGTEMRRVAQLAKRGFVAGIDLSEVMLRQASRRNRGYIREGRVELRLASMSAIPYPDGSFDKVFGINCIQFSPDLLHVRRDSPRIEAGRLSRTGGTASLERSHGCHRSGNWPESLRCYGRGRLRWMQSGAEARLAQNDGVCHRTKIDSFSPGDCMRD